jgi:hypothetical protein
MGPTSRVRVRLEGVCMPQLHIMSALCASMLVWVLPMVVGGSADMHSKTARVGCNGSRG